MSDHHVRWSSFIGEHHYVDHIYYMIHAQPFGLCRGFVTADVLEKGLSRGAIATG